MTLVGPAPVVDLQRVLVRLPDAVALRGHADPAATFARGGDIDVLVRDLNEAERTLIDAFGRPLRRVVRAHMRGYAYDWGAVDLLDALQWRGAPYLSAESVRRDAIVDERGVRAVSPLHEAVVCLLESLLWGGFYPKRYAGQVRAAARQDPAGFLALLVEALGEAGSELVDAASGDDHTRAEALVPRLRRALWWRAFRRAPWPVAAGAWAHVRREVGLRLRPPVPWFAVLGPDGSGKSSVLAALEAQLPPSLGGVAVFHWRPGVVRPDRGDGGPVTDPHGKPARGPVASVAKLGLLWLDWQLGYWLRIVHLRAKERIVVFDRCYLDLLVDPRRYRYGAGAALARAVGSTFPQPDVLVLLDAPPEVLRARKTEVTLEETVRQRTAYAEAVRSARGGVVVDAAQPLAAVTRDVARAMTDALRRWEAR